MWFLMLSNFCLTARDATASEPWGVRTRPAERDQQQQQEKKKNSYKQKTTKTVGRGEWNTSAVRWEGGKQREGGMEADGHRLGGSSKLEEERKVGWEL